MLCSCIGQVHYFIVMLCSFIGGNGDISCYGGLLDTYQQIMCIDIDECTSDEVDVGSCPGNSTCMNLLGTYTCAPYISVPGPHVLQSLTDAEAVEFILKDELLGGGDVFTFQWSTTGFVYFPGAHSSH